MHQRGIKLMEKSITKNLVYNIILQIVTLFMPLITTPYVSRVLGTEGIGTYSYTLSIVQYFNIIGTLGISMYANREIAYVRDDKQKMSKTFWSICCFKLITTSIALILFIIFFGIKGKYKNIFIIQSMNIIATMIDISWLYMGLEDFKKTVTRNLAVKICGVICIFAFVKDYNDLTKYVLINGFMVLLGNLSMWMYVPKTVQKIKIKAKDVKLHTIPTIQLFIPQIAIQVYAVLDKTMLGSLCTIESVGLYEQSQKVTNLVLGIITSLGVVMLPRMSNTFMSGNIKKMNEYLNKSLNAIIYVSIPMTLGLVGISNKFVPWFFGPEFSKVSTLMIVLSPILFLIAISNVLGTQYLLPANRTTEFTISVTCGAVANFILNLILIKKYNALGTCISTVVAEFIVTLLQYIFVRENIEIKFLVKSTIKYIISGILMFIGVKFIGTLMGDNFITTLIQVFVGIIIYFSILIILKEEFNKLVIKELIEKINKILNKI